MDETVFIRDIIGMTAFFGVLSFAWFGWGQENPPQKLRPLLGVGSVLAILTAIAGIYLLIKNWGLPTALASDNGYMWFGVVDGVEILLCLVGAIILYRKGRPKLIAPWISLIVALHFIPLAIIFKDPMMYVVTAVALVAVLLSGKVAKWLKLEINTAVCLSMGVVLLAFAVRGLALFLLTQ